MSATRPRRVAVAGLGLVLVALVVVLVVSDPFGGGPKPSGASDNASQTSITTVKRETLSSQTQVNATLGYAGAANIRVPTGTPPSAVQQAEQAVVSSERILATARASLAADTATLENARAAASAARAKEAIDCAGENAAQAAGSSAPGGEAGAGDSPANGGDVERVRERRADAGERRAGRERRGDEGAGRSGVAVLGAGRAGERRDPPRPTARASVADYGRELDVHDAAGGRRGDRAGT